MINISVIALVVICLLLSGFSLAFTIYAAKYLIYKKRYDALMDEKNPLEEFLAGWTRAMHLKYPKILISIYYLSEHRRKPEFTDCAYQIIINNKNGGLVENRYAMVVTYEILLELEEGFKKYTKASNAYEDSK